MNKIECIAELKQEIADLEIKSNIANQRQMALKILLNSGYGAFANPYFMFYDIRIAKSITYTAQLVTKWIIQFLESKGLEIAYSDTDSCTYDTEIISKKYGKIKIGKYFDIVNGIDEYKNTNNIVKHLIEDDDILSYSTKAEFKSCNYVMKHKVKKKLYRIKTKENEVTITEDHSIIIDRNGQLIEVKPTELLPQDKIIQLI